MVWEIVTGRAPGDWYVLHSCDNPPCCNPAHLRLGTHLENIQDRTDRGRYRRGGIGEAHHSARLTKTTARDAYESVVAGEPVLDVAARYGVTKEAIYKIVYGQSWKELGLTPIKLGRRDSA